MTPIIAVGDEDGRVYLSREDALETARSALQVHRNAIMDAQFSSDDSRLVTGSGDQSAVVVDVQTTVRLHVLARHSASVKQVRFQPGDDNILATSSRDGTVHIWDLRCSDSKAVKAIWGAGAPYAGSTRALRRAHAEVERSPNLSVPRLGACPG